MNESPPQELESPIPENERLTSPMQGDGVGQELSQFLLSLPRAPRGWGAHHALERTAYPRHARLLAARTRQHPSRRVRAGAPLGVVRRILKSPMKLAAFLFLLLTAVGFAQPSPTEDSVRRAQAVATEVLPRLQFKNATFEDALAAIRRAWDERHPNDPLPVALTDEPRSVQKANSYQFLAIKLLAPPSETPCSAML